MNIAETIRQIVLGGNLELYLKVCTVDEVDEDARTVECTPIDDGAPLTGVNLQANQRGENGVVLFPAKDSYVIVGFLNPAAAVVLLTTEITKAVITTDKTEITVESNNISIATEKLSVAIDDATADIQVNGKSVLKIEDGKSTFNAGSETMVNGNELKNQLQTMSGRIDAIINAISSAGVAAMDGGATFKAALVATLSPHLANKENFAQIIDNNIKH
ncbi:MAG: hypothetical protein ACI4BD_05940 [Paludibacteraceae bacterium]